MLVRTVSVGVNSVGSADSVCGANRCSSARSVGRAHSVGETAHVKLTERTVRVRVDQPS